MFAQLANALQQRLDLIADHAWRDRDQPGHLQALQQISAHITTLAAALPPDTDPQLLHYLERASYTKALDRAKQLTAQG